MTGIEKAERGIIVGHAGLDPTKRYYKTQADDYFRATHSTNLEPLWDKLSSRLTRGDRILDIGSGSGRDLRYFAEHGFCTVGIDYSSELVELARAYSKQPVVLGDFATLPFEAASFDAAWSIGSFVHVPRECISRVLSEVHRVLKEGAFLLTSVKKGTEERVDALGRYNSLYLMDEWVRTLSQNGYEVISGEEMTELRKTGLGTTTDLTWLVCLSRAT